jgi:hypothetical protein
MKSRSAHSRTGLRPTPSAKRDANGDAKSAQRAVEEVMRDLSCGVRTRPEREEPMETRAAEVTPVSSLALWHQISFR